MTGPSGVVTFLFTDVEGSTRRWDTDADAMRAALAAHDEVLHRAVESHHGWLFKHTGDGVCATFASPRDAVDAAIAAQRDLQLPVRMGIATGEAQCHEGDYFGAVLNRTARLMAVGHGGQILLDGVTAALISDVDLLDLGHASYATSTNVVAAHAEAGLRQVVRAEREELGRSRRFRRRSVRRAALRSSCRPCTGTSSRFPSSLRRDAVDDFNLQVELLLEADQRDHHFRLDLDAFLQHGRGRLEDGAGLHLGDFGILDAQAAAAETEHGIEFVQFVHARGDFVGRDAQLGRPARSAGRCSCGRNSCSGGSSRRMHAGKPFNARKMPSKSLC